MVWSYETILELLLPWIRSWMDIGVDFVRTNCRCLSFLEDINYWYYFSNNFFSFSVRFIRFWFRQSADTSLTSSIFLSLQYHCLSLHIWFLRLILFLTEWWNWYFVKGDLCQNTEERKKKKFTHVLWKWYSCCEWAWGICKIVLRPKYSWRMWLELSECFRHSAKGQFSLQFKRVNLSVCLMGAPLYSYMMYNKNKYSSNLFVFLIQTGFCPFDRLCKYNICSFFEISFILWCSLSNRIFFCSSWAIHLLYALIRWTCFTNRHTINRFSSLFDFYDVPELVLRSPSWSSFTYSTYNNRR